MAWFCVIVRHGIYPVCWGVQVGLFSVVASTFILDAENNLQPDFQENQLRSPQDYCQYLFEERSNRPAVAFPRWNNPGPTVVRVQSILYSSLTVSLLAAFIAMLASNDSIVTLRLECADLLSIAAAIDN